MVVKSYIKLQIIQHIHFHKVQKPVQLFGLTPDTNISSDTTHKVTYGNFIVGRLFPLSLMDASVSENSSDVPNLMIEVDHTDDRLLNIKLEFDVEGSYISHYIYLSVSI